jgi:hypothetical protein
MPIKAVKLTGQTIRTETIFSKISLRIGHYQNICKEASCFMNRYISSHVQILKLWSDRFTNTAFMTVVTQIEHDWKSIYTKPTYIRTWKLCFIPSGKRWTEYTSANSENTSPSRHPSVRMRTCTWMTNGVLGRRREEGLRKCQHKKIFKQKAHTSRQDITTIQVASGRGMTFISMYLRIKTIAYQFFRSPKE